MGWMWFQSFSQCGHTIMCYITAGQPEEIRVDFQKVKNLNNSIHVFLGNLIWFHFVCFTSASLVYSEDFVVRDRASSPLSLVDHWCSDPDLLDCRSLSWELKPKRCNFSLWFHICPTELVEIYASFSNFMKNNICLPYLSVLSLQFGWWRTADSSSAPWSPGLLLPKSSSLSWQFDFRAEVRDPKPSVLILQVESL